VQVIQGGESFIALSEGLQNALHACGGVPQQHRTDSLSAAFRKGRSKRQKFTTQDYEALCAYYQLTPTRNNTSIAHENGSIESPHGHFKRKLRQALLMRGSCDFESVMFYQQFIEQVVVKVNAKCSQKFAEEHPYLQPLPRYRYPDYEVLSVRVSRYSAITVRCVLYSVPSRLIGRQLTVHLYHDRLVGYLGKQWVVELPRLRMPAAAKQRRARCIHYPHIIESLRRKPRAFLYCTWQQEILPNTQWRQLWQQLSQQMEPDLAARLMVEALYIAATQDRETAVADYLQQHIEHKTLTLNGLQRHFLPQVNASVPQLTIQQHPLSAYDQLLHPGCAPQTQPLPEPQPAPQATASASHAFSLGIYRTPSVTGTLVLCSILARLVRIGSPAPRPKPIATRPLRSPTPQRKKFYHL
jgi:hypothetical protein